MVWGGEGLVSPGAGLPGRGGVVPGGVDHLRPVGVLPVVALVPGDGRAVEDVQCDVVSCPAAQRRDSPS